MSPVILFAGTVFMGFFAIMNPVANTPVFISLTKNIDSEKTKRKIAFHSILYSFIIVTLFCISGHFIFKAFGITLPAFQITGGILLFFVGMNMLHGKTSNIQHPSTDDHKEHIRKQVLQANENVAISPLCMPILAGPGTIATAMNFVGANATTKLSPVVHISVVVFIFAVMCLITFLMFISGDKLVKYLGKGFINVISRIMGLILSVIAVQMVIAGVTHLIKADF